MMTQEELTAERAIQTDIWLLRKKYYKGEHKDEEFWTMLCEEAEELHKKYNSVYVDQMIFVCIEDIDRRSSPVWPGEDRAIIDRLFEKIKEDRKNGR